MNGDPGVFHRNWLNIPNMAQSTSVGCLWAPLALRNQYVNKLKIRLHLNGKGNTYFIRNSSHPHVSFQFEGERREFGTHFRFSNSCMMTMVFSVAAHFFLNIKNTKLSWRMTRHLIQLATFFVISCSQSKSC